MLLDVIPAHQHCRGRDGRSRCCGAVRGSDIGPSAVVGVGIRTGVDDVAVQLTIARPRTTAVIARNKSARR